MRIRGINYDVGTEFSDDDLSREIWSEADVARDMRAIRDALHCTAVNVYGTDLERLKTAARIAIEEGLDVWFQFRAIDIDRRGLLEALARAAQAAEALRGAGPVTLNTGCEITLYARGFLPGGSVRTRSMMLVLAWPLFRLLNWRLNRHLADVVAVARRHFHGPITYSAGSWERVDWRGFDIAGVNLYHDRFNAGDYGGAVRAIDTHGKPLVITEFGSATFAGADRKGGRGWAIVDYSGDGLAIKDGHDRSERTQADLITASLQLFERAGVAGAFVYDFMAASFPHRAEPSRDLDMASFGIVKVRPPQDGDTSLQWEPKAAFGALAETYAAMAGDGAQ